MGHRHKKTYELVRVLDAGRIILRDKRGFGKNRAFYDELHDDLKNDWSTRCSIDRKTDYQIGEHVLVQSNRLDEPRRAIIRCNSGMATSVAERSYSVYVYDEGDLEEVDDHRITSLSVERKEQLEPRTVIVHLVGVVPAKVVVDLAKKALGDEQNHLIITQDSAWTNRANRLATEWLEQQDLKYLAITDAKSNTDGSVYGQIYRKFKKTVFNDADCENQPEAAGRKKKEKRKSDDFLSDFLCDAKLALFNDKLAESQLKLREPLKLGTSSNHVTDPSNVEAAASKEKEDYDEDMLKDTRLSFGSEGSVDHLPTHPESLELRDMPQQEVTDPNDCAGTMLLPSLCPSEEYGHYDFNHLGNTRVSFDENQSVKSDTENSSTSNEMLKEKMRATNKLIWSDRTWRLNCGGREERRLKGELIDTRTEDANLINLPGRLLVRGTMVRPPYLNNKEYRLSRGLMRGLEALGVVENLPDVHRIVAPNFMRGSDVIVIGPDAGKTEGKCYRSLTYILTVIRMLYDMYEIRGNIDDHSAPNAIIVVNSYNTGASIESYIHSLLKFCQDVPLRVKFVCKDTPKDSDDTYHYNYNHKRRMIPGGLGILITTMAYMDAVMQTRDGPFLFESLRFLIFEEVELYLKNYNEEVLTFIRAAQENYEISVDGLRFQIALSGSKWSPEIEDFYKEMVKDRAPMVAIGAPNQVLCYAKIKWQFHYVKEEENKLKMLLELLMTCVEVHQRTVVACSTPSVANCVYDYLSSNVNRDVQILIAVSNSNKEELDHMLELWKKYPVSMFIISDNMLNEIKVTNATCLVCFDSPVKAQLKIQRQYKRPVAAQRFGYLWSNIRHIEAEQDSLQTIPSRHSESVELVSHFLMTGKEHNFYPIYKFAKSLHDTVEFPPELEEQALMTEKGGLQNVDMCQGIRLFGFCNNPDRENCPSRHVFSREELLAPTSVPKTGEIKFTIVECQNPSLYRVKLKQHFEFENKKRICKISYVDEDVRRKSELAKYYESTEDNSRRKPLHTLTEGTLCVIKVKDLYQDYYARARVERIVQRDRHEVPLVIRVYCVDSGLILHPSVDHVYETTEEFQKWSPLAVELILLNLQPTREELEYRKVSEKQASKMTKDKVYDAKIYLSLGNTVWVNPMVEYLVDPATKLMYRGDSVRLELINQKIAEFNKNHWDVLKAASVDK